VSVGAVSSTENADRLEEGVDVFRRREPGQELETHGKVAEANLHPIGMLRIRAQQGHDSSLVADLAENVEECFFPDQVYCKVTTAPLFSNLFYSLGAMSTVTPS